jgi:hypothetical protein
MRGRIYEGRTSAARELLTHAIGVLERKGDMRGREKAEPTSTQP